MHSLVKVGACPEHACYRSTKERANNFAQRISCVDEGAKNMAEGSDPYGTRTRVAAVKGRSPRPLDEGAAAVLGFTWIARSASSGVDGRLYNEVTFKERL